MKEYERGSWDVARKIVPHFTWDYRGEHALDRNFDPMIPCRLCGRPTYFCGMKGNIEMRACEGEGCANNPDSDWKTPLTMEGAISIGNPYKIWSPPRPLI